jgi:signal transduction histidine kinase
MNLIMNAIQAMPGGGHLEISTQRGEGECIVRVADTGIGIAPDCLDRIFEAFYTTSLRAQGLDSLCSAHCFVA